jgi:hypothetical protein
MASTLARFESFGFLHVRTPKTLVYAAPNDIGEALHHLTVDVCQNIRICPGNFERNGRAVAQRLDAGFPPRRPGFAYVQHVGFVVDKASLGQVFS